MAQDRSARRCKNLVSLKSQLPITRHISPVNRPREIEKLDAEQKCRQNCYFGLWGLHISLR